jgi:hypothetical protein
MLKTLLIALLFITLPACAEEADSVFDVTEAPNSDDSLDDSAFNKIDANDLSVLPSAISEGYYSGAKIIALNKITANSETMVIQVNTTAYFNNAKIELHKCWKSGNQISPSSQMLITILEHKFDDDQKSIFSGWIISGDPALSTFEHPVYEILAVECVGHKLH